MSAPNYAPCLKVILQNEGGYVNNPRDPGGETNYGITKATARANGYDGSMHTIPMSVVEKIYRTKFWTGCDNLPAGVDLVVFDFAVNSGPGRAFVVLKRHNGKGKTPSQVINAVCDDRLEFLKGLHTWGTFGPGWSRRVAHVRAVALKMASDQVQLAPAPTVPAPSVPPAPTNAPVTPSASPKPAPEAPKAPTKQTPQAPKVSPKSASGTAAGLSAILAAFMHSWWLGAAVAAAVLAIIIMVVVANSKK